MKSRKKPKASNTAKTQKKAEINPNESRDSSIRAWIAGGIGIVCPPLILPFMIGGTTGWFSPMHIMMIGPTAVAIYVAMLLTRGDVEGDVTFFNRPWMQRGLMEQVAVMMCVSVVYFLFLAGAMVVAR